MWYNPSAAVLYGQNGKCGIPKMFAPPQTSANLVTTFYLAFSCLYVYLLILSVYSVSLTLVLVHILYIEKAWQLFLLRTSCTFRI